MPRISRSIGARVRSILGPDAAGALQGLTALLVSSAGDLLAGTFRLSRRRDTIVGQNILASLALTLFVSLALAVLAKAVSIGFGLHNTISVGALVVISIIGG